MLTYSKMTLTLFFKEAKPEAYLNFLFTCTIF